MEGLITQALELLRGLWHRRWAGLALAWLVAIIGLAVVFRLPQNYEASARVFVDTQTVLKPLMSGLVVQSGDGRANMLSRTLISRSNVERLLTTTKLDDGVMSAAEKGRLIDSLSSKLKIASVGIEGLYTLSFRDPNPQQAKQVVEGMLSIFVDSNKGERREDASQALQFIEEQIKAYQLKLEEAEARVKSFKLRHMGVLGTDGKDYFTRMSALSQQIDQARLSVRSAEQGRDAIKREVSGEDPVFLPDPNAVAPVTPQQAVVVPEIDARLDVMKKNLDELLRRFTDRHPDVIGTRRIIEQLEEQRRGEVNRELERRSKTVVGPNKPQSMGPIERNPVFQRLKVALAESEAEVASARGRLQELELQYQRLSASAKMIPQLDSEFVQLNRDYEVHKRNYESLVSRRESAVMSSNMEAAGTAAFRIVDPPRVSQYPVAPNHLLLIPLVLLVAIGVGMLASMAWSQVQPTFHEPALLKQLTGRPLLGTVSVLPQAGLIRKRRMSNLAFFSALGTLVLGYGVAFVFAFTTSRIA